MKFIVKKLTYFKALAPLVLLLGMASLMHAADPSRPIRVTNMDNDAESFSLPEQVIQLSETFRSVLEAVADQDKVSLSNQYYQTMNDLKSVLFAQPVLVAFEAYPTPENTQEVRYLLRSLKLEKRIKLLYLADHLNMPNLLALATDMVAQMMINPGILHNILPNQQAWQAFMKKHSTLYETPIFNNMVAQAVLRDLPAWQNLWEWREVAHVDPIADERNAKVSVSGDGQRIVIGYTDGQVHILDHTGTLVANINPAANENSAQVAISGDGQRIVIGYEGGLVRIVDDTGNQIGHVIPAVDEYNPQVAISGDGQRIVIGYWNGQVRIFDGAGNEVGQVDPVAAGQRIPQVAISSDGQRIVIGYNSGLVRIVDDAGNQMGLVNPISRRLFSPQVAISDDGQRIVIGYDSGLVRIVDDAGNLLRNIDPTADEDRPQVAISSDGQHIVIGYSRGQVRIVGNAGNQIGHVVPAVYQYAPRVAINGNGQRIVIGYSTEPVHIVDSAGAQIGQVTPAAGGRAPQVTINGNGQRIVMGYSNGLVRIFEQQEPPNLNDITLQQAQLIVAILQHIITVNAIPPHLVSVFESIPEDIRERLAQ